MDKPEILAVNIYLLSLIQYFSFTTKVCIIYQYNGRRIENPTLVRGMLFTVVNDYKVVENKHSDYNDQPYTTHVWLHCVLLWVSVLEDKDSIKSRLSFSLKFKFPWSCVWH